MTKEEIIKHLHEALNSVDITFPYRYVFVEAIEAISQPSLPSNLDEAAEKNFETMEVLEHENIFEETHRKIFKAGAEWMAGQGETIEGYIAGTNKVAAIRAIPRKEHNKGDKVVVQIRKK